jgi:hypothetical protein
MVLQTLVLVFLFTWLIYASISHKLSSKTKEAACSPPPIFPSWIPFASHIYGIATKGSNPYLSSLWYLQTPFYPFIVSAIHTKDSQFDPKLASQDSQTPRTGHAFGSPARFG